MNTIVNTLVGNYLKSKRIEYGMTGAEVGKLLHVSQQQVSRYENGVNTISLDLVLLFLDKLDLSVESFFIYLLKEIENDIKDNEKNIKDCLYTDPKFILV
ncbi:MULTISPECIES: helix-turn-helix domain-containing protein [unclassified Providencia]|uniref:helix-turn-helix domain-containing protein n=1 Tax=unclassified Providencia TaxID=2633465 RepID=UPI000E873648|nr:helix-turn-helix transcriptional regulator [Providencia sp.]HBO21601.1 XRE family transcriptional regulator [Providencia sp.]